MNMRQILTFLLLFFSLLLYPHTVPADDSFIQGYGTAVLVREFGASPSSLLVKNGVIMLNADSVRPEKLSAAISILMSIPGVTRVEIVGGETLATERVSDSGPRASAEAGRQERTVSEDAAEISPHIRIFEPLIADPHWPRFALSYHMFTDNGDLNNLVASAIGGTIPVYQNSHPLTGTWQAVIQAAAFAINDLDTTSWDLLNSDYQFGLAFQNRKGPVSSIFRLYHFSTHVGDEFILNSGAERQDLSFEAVDTIVSLSASELLRVYGGGAYRFSRNPKDMNPWSVQYGAELKSPRLYAKIVRPIGGINFYNKGENDWHSEMSVRIGAEIESRETLWHKVQFLLGYFNGPSPYGQFYYESHEYLDFGIHIHY